MEQWYSGSIQICLLSAVQLRSKCSTYFIEPKSSLATRCLLVQPFSSLLYTASLPDVYFFLSLLIALISIKKTKKTTSIYASSKPQIIEMCHKTQI